MATRTRQRYALGQLGRPATAEDLLSPDQIRLHSHQSPSLHAGSYSISVFQDVGPRGASPFGPPIVNEGPGKKLFTVDAPRFSIPSDDVFDVYPPPGSVENNRVLPHVLFKEPSLPWERLVKEGLPQPRPDEGAIPWMALLAFEHDELLAPPPSLKHAKQDPVSQKVSANLQDLLASESTLCPLQGSVDASTAAVTSADFVFVSPSLFTALIYDTYDKNSGKLATPPAAAPSKADLARYKLLAHIRQNTGDSDGQEAGRHSCVISHRTGPHSPRSNTTVLVHLVSLEGWAEMSVPLVPAKDRVALNSLFSWSYVVAPSDPANFLDVMKDLAAAPAYKTGPPPDKNGDCLWPSDNRMLRFPSQVIQKLEDNDSLSALGTRLLRNRLLDGYSVIKHRLPTGELTPTFIRGPLAPVRVPDGILQTARDAACQDMLNETEDHPRAHTPAQSNLGKDWEIMDPRLGVLDITYSSAWQLGRLLGLSDREFGTALVTMRRQAQNAGFQAIAEPLKLNLLGGMIFEFRLAGEVLSGLAAPSSFKPLLRVLTTISASPAESGPNRGLLGGPSCRGMPSPNIDHLNALKLATSNRQELVVKVLLESLDHVRGQTEVAGGGEPYNEYNKPSGHTYPPILNRLLDLSNLAHIPLHYLITNPAYLPPESMRFFYVDPNWINAVVDGALSIGNNFDVEDVDLVKAAIKNALDKYKSSELVTPEGRSGHLPQFPSYGLLLRSAVVSTWKDLRISAPFPPGWQGNKLEILDKFDVASDTIMVLLDRCPEDVATSRDIPLGISETERQALDAQISDPTKPLYLLQRIEISQPPHQQCFALGATLSEKVLRMPAYKRVTLNTHEGAWDDPPLTGPKLASEFKHDELDPNVYRVYDWENKLIRVRDFAAMVGEAMQIPQPRGFQEFGPVLFALHLGSAPLRMVIAKLRPNEVQPKWPNQGQPQDDHKNVSGAAQEPAKSDRHNQQQSLPDAEPVASRSVVASTVSPDSGHPRTMTVSQWGAGKLIQLTKTFGVASFEDIRRAERTPAETYRVPVHRAPYLPAPIGVEGDFGISNTDLGQASPVFTAQFSLFAPGTSEISYIPIVAGSMAPGDPGSRPPPFDRSTVDLLMIFDMSGGELKIEDLQQLSLFFPFGVGGTISLLPGVQLPDKDSPVVPLTRRYAGPGPRVLNRPRFLARMAPAATEQGLAVTITSRAGGMFPAKAVRGLAVLLPRVETDSERSGVSPVHIEATFGDGTRALSPAAVHVKTMRDSQG
ncbi:hypothetical protein OQA88_7994 [Cercophora sp. LCS_1]